MEPVCIEMVKIVNGVIVNDESPASEGSSVSSMASGEFELNIKVCEFTFDKVCMESIIIVVNAITILFLVSSGKFSAQFLLPPCCWGSGE